MVMGFATNRTNLRKLALLALGSILVAAPLFGHSGRQAKPDQTKSDHTKSDQGPDQTAQSSSEPTPAPAAATSAPTGSPSANSAPAQLIVPAGTRLPLILHNSINTRNAQPSDPVYLETVFPVIVNGKIAIPAGSYVQGEITEAKRPGKGKGAAEVRLRLTTLVFPNGYTINFDAVPTNAGTGGNEYADKEGQITKDRDRAGDAGTVIKTTGAGAGIGAIAGGAQGAGIGAGIGAAAGLAAVLMSRGPELELPRGSNVDIMLDRPLPLDPAKLNVNDPGRPSSLPGPPTRAPARSFPF
jgi:type IV secretory pathway VirB10-like protein